VQVAAIVVLTLGEALWSPRSYEYTVSIAPKGRESTYVGMSSLPYFMAKSVVGVLSGQLLSAYCPATGPRNSSLMWTIIGFTVLAGPLGILLLRKVIERGAEAPAATVAPLVETGVTE
jgi:dipeptide/tripeptide permease